MKLSHPFFISSHLAPAIKIGNATLSYVDGEFMLETDDQALSHTFTVNPPQCRIHGATDESELQDLFAAACGFMAACAESRAYARRKGCDEMTGENSDLFPANVGEWCEANSDELQMMDCELSETKGLITP